MSRSWSGVCRPVYTQKDTTVAGAEWARGPVVGKWVREVREGPGVVRQTHEATRRTLAFTELYEELFKGFGE